MPLTPEPQEQARRDDVLALIIEAIRQNRTIRLPDFDPATERGSDEFALLSIGLEDNEFSGQVGEYRYQFEGEEDLLHLIVTRSDLELIPAESAQEVASFLYAGVPPALMWFKPGKRSHHFYLGHDVLLEFLAGPN